MWIVRLALRRPYTVAVMCLLILVMGVLSLTRMVVDIFPAIDIPVVAVVWNYPGLSAAGHGAAGGPHQRARLLDDGQRHRAHRVAVDPRHRPAQGLLPAGHRHRRRHRADLRRVQHAPAHHAAGDDAARPSSSSTPRTCRSRSSPSRARRCPSRRSSTTALNFIRVRLFTIPGLSTPAPFGGKQRQINVDIDPAAAGRQGALAHDVVNALQHVERHPAGRARRASAAASTTSCMNSSPADGGRVQQHPGQGRRRRAGAARATWPTSPTASPTRPTSCASTATAPPTWPSSSTPTPRRWRWSTPRGTLLPVIQAAAPEGPGAASIDFDQSLFVRGAIKGVLREALISSLLVSLMILVFLGSWRSMVIVCTSIPLAIFSAIIGLKLTGHTHQHHDAGRPGAGHRHAGRRRHRRGREHPPQPRAWASRSPWPSSTAPARSRCRPSWPRWPSASSSSRSCCWSGPAKFLFAPLALAVVLAMLASYLLSRTLVPTLARMLMPASEPTDRRPTGPPRHRRSVDRFAMRFNRLARPRASSASRTRYAGLLGRLPCTTGASRWAIAGAARRRHASGWSAWSGTDFFPSVDAGLMKLHFRAPTGTRIEETEHCVARVEERIRQDHPAGGARDDQRHDRRAALLQPGLRADRQRRPPWTPRS